MTTKPDDLAAFEAFQNAFGYTPETVDGKADQLNRAIRTGDSAVVATVLFDQARDTGVPVTAYDENADEVFPYPDLQPFGNHGLQQVMEALDHLELELRVHPKSSVGDAPTTD
jgi:hypothetical protein